MNGPHKSARNKKIFKPLDSPVVSYFGVVIQDDSGQPYGTLCHYDFQPCQQRISDAPFLETIAQLYYPWIKRLNQKSIINK